MSADEFEKTLRELYHRKPFVPFFVEREGEEPIYVDDPRALCFSGGYAAFVGKRDDHVFHASEVRQFRPVTRNAS